MAWIVSGGHYTRAAHTTWMLAEGVGARLVDGQSRCKLEQMDSK